MTVNLRLEFETESNAIAVFERLALDEQIIAAASIITLSDGRMLEFDRYRADLKAGRAQ
jgi:hypothetical protein